MAQMENARCDAGAVKAGGLFTAQDKRDISETQYQPRTGDLAAGPRLERMVERVHALGPRPLGELLAEIAVATGQHVRVVDLVEEYAQLDPAVLRFLGGDKFPTAPLELVR